MTKLGAGGRYDIICPSAEYADRLDKAKGLLHDSTATRSQQRAEDLVPIYDDGWWDPGRRHTVPYTYYTTGIAWRRQIVSDDRFLERPRQPGRRRAMFILDDFQEAIGEANLINGWDLNTVDPNELDEAPRTPARPEGVRARDLSTNSTQNCRQRHRLRSTRPGTATSSTSATRSTTRELQFQTCKEGSRSAPTCMFIPVTPRSPGTALKFIDWIIQPDNAAQNVSWNGYPQPTEGGKEAYRRAGQGTSRSSIDDRGPRKGQQFANLEGEDREAWDRTWTEVKAA